MSLGVPSKLKGCVPKVDSYTTPSSTRHPGHNVQNVYVCAWCTWRDECARVARMSAGKCIGSLAAEA